MTDSQGSIEFTPDEFHARLEALATDLAAFPSGVWCPWPIARIFNEMLKRAKRGAPDDRLLRGIAPLEKAGREGEAEVAENSRGHGQSTHYPNQPRADAECSAFRMSSSSAYRF